MTCGRKSPLPPARRPSAGGIFFKLMVALALVGMAFLLYLLREPLLRSIGSFWVVSEQPAAADVIILLGDDNYAAQRAARAAELYHERRAPRIAASGRYLRPYVSIADLMQRDLTDRGVPKDAIIPVASFVANTREEAVVMRKLAERRGWKKLLVVTSNYHTRRARLIYERVFAGTAEVRVIAAYDTEYNPEDWWRSRGAWKHFLYEAMGYVVAAWETRNAQAAIAIAPDKLDAKTVPALAN